MHKEERERLTGDGGELCGKKLGKHTVKIVSGELRCSKTSETKWPMNKSKLVLCYASFKLHWKFDEDKENLESDNSGRSTGNFVIRTAFPGLCSLFLRVSARDSKPKMQPQHNFPENHLKDDRCKGGPQTNRSAERTESQSDLGRRLAQCDPEERQ